MNPPRLNPKLAGPKKKNCVQSIYSNLPACSTPHQILPNVPLPIFQLFPSEIAARASLHSFDSCFPYLVLPPMHLQPYGRGYSAIAECESPKKISPIHPGRYLHSPGQVIADLEACLHNFLGVLDLNRHGATSSLIRVHSPTTAKSIWIH
jgi:hypothetical protein